MNCIVEMLNITKRFPGIVANDNISIQLNKGEIHALLGENGAGKSTLMSILFGLYQPDEGVIKKDGIEVKINNPNDANKLGIGMVHQHFKLVQNFTVLENIILGVETIKNSFLNMSEAREKVLTLSQTYNLKIDPDSLVSDITVGMQQRVEILKTLYRENEILIFDEPTAVLTPDEIVELMGIMKRLIQEGKSILFITHKLAEIKEIADRCTVIRKGKYIDTVNVEDVTKEDMSELMVGHKVNLEIDKTPATPGEVVLDIKGLTVKSKKGKNAVNDVSFQVKAGEIVCIAGIDGNGQEELIYALTGMIPSTSSEFKLLGNEISKKTIKQRNEIGMAHIPADRHKHGLVLEYNIAKNMVIKKINNKKFQKMGFINFNNMYNHTDELIEKFDIRASNGSHTDARSMSGGNQQKVIVAREISEDTALLIAVQPTRGLDVGAIEYIHKQIISQRDKGKAILLVSLELDEVLGLSDRILVIYEGEIVADLNAQETNNKELGMFMAGAKKGGAHEE
ncbi:MAG: ABC transporter ATP-binding protein [Oscillospiraceae bacterium]